MRLQQVFQIIIAPLITVNNRALTTKHIMTHKSIIRNSHAFEPQSTICVDVYLFIGSHNVYYVK